MRAYGQKFRLYHSGFSRLCLLVSNHRNIQINISTIDKAFYTPTKNAIYAAPCVCVCMCLPAAAYTTIHLIVASWQLHILISLLHSWMQFFIPVFVLLLLYDTCTCVLMSARTFWLFLPSSMHFCYPQRELQWQCNMSVYGSFICNTRIISFVLGSTVIFLFLPLSTINLFIKRTTI